MSSLFAVIFAALTVCALATFGLYEGWTIRRALGLGAVVLAGGVATLVSLALLPANARIVASVFAIAGLMCNVAAGMRRDPLPRPIWMKKQRR